MPNGFCVTSEAFRQFIELCPEMDQLQTALAAVGPEEREKAQSLAAQMRVCLAAAPFPPAVQDAVLAAWRTLGVLRSYAVRSSATAEDQPGASFAGQGDTILNVRGRKALLDAVRTCWLSLFSDRAVLYRVHHHIDHKQLGTVPFPARRWPL